MSLDTSVLVLVMDDKIWVDSDSLIGYLREVERQATEHVAVAKSREDEATAVAAYSSGEMVRQIADGLVLTTMIAHDKIRAKRESRR